jgi:superfamily II DNA or RNA helicase
MAHRTLTRSGYILQKKYITSTELARIKKDLTVTPLVLPAFKDFVRPKPYKVYLESPERIFLPRYYGIENFGEPVNTNFSDGLDIDIKVHMTLRPHQLPAAEAIMKQFGIHAPTGSADTSTTASMDPDSTVKNNHNDVGGVDSSRGGGGVLSLPCGYGKTVLAIWAIAQLKKKTLVIVNKEFLMDQWVDSFEKFSNARVGILQQNKMEIDGNDVVVAMLHSICMKEYPKGIFDEFGLVIFDECHHIASDMFSKSLPKVATKYMLGLSATPERKDGLSKVFYFYLGKLFHQERRSGSNLVVVKQIHCMSGSPYYQEIFLKNGVKNTGGMLTQMIEFEERNRMILHILSLLIKLKRKTLVLSSRREHLEWIYDALQKANFRRPDNTFATFGLYWGKQQMNKKQYKKMLEESAKCDIVLGTCQLAQEGLDIPDLDTLLFATPMTDVIQAVGRILRKYHQVNPFVIDIVDKFGNFTKHLKQRQEFYDDEEYFCERANVVLHDDKAKNKYTNLLDQYLPTVPDLTEFEAGRSRKSAPTNSTGVTIPANSADPVAITATTATTATTSTTSNTGVCSTSTKPKKEPAKGKKKKSVAVRAFRPVGIDCDPQDTFDNEDPADDVKNDFAKLPSGCLLEAPDNDNNNNRIVPSITPKVKISDYLPMGNNAADPLKVPVKLQSKQDAALNLQKIRIVPKTPITPKINLAEIKEQQQVALSQQKVRIADLPKKQEQEMKALEEARAKAEEAALRAAKALEEAKNAAAQLAQIEALTNTKRVDTKQAFSVPASPRSPVSNDLLDKKSATVLNSQPTETIKVMTKKKFF